MDREPEWNAENMNKRQGDTTFKTCGWCEHVGCGFIRYDCHLNSTCSLMKDYGTFKDVVFDTPCKITQLGKLDIDNIIQSKKYGITNLKAEIKRTQKEIATLRSISAIDRPPLPDKRPCQYYPLGDIVWVLFKGKWSKGTVVSGYRSGDGCVSYILDDNKKCIADRGWGSGVAVPGVLKDWEYKYFKNNFDDYLVWLDGSNKKYNGTHIDLDEYIEAMKK